MGKFLKEVTECAVEVIDSGFKVTPFEALQIAVQMQHNRILSDAFMVGLNVPGALEAIAMELGAARDGVSIKDAIYSLQK